MNFKPSRSAWAGALCVAACAAGALPASAAPQLSVTGYQLQATKRISNTVYEYSYRVTAVNRGSAAVGAEAEVTALGDWLTPMQGSVYFGKVAAGESATSADVFTIRHDRGYKFTETDLRWTFSASDGSFTGRFAGPAATAVAAAITDYVDDTPYAPSAVEADGDGQAVLRTDLAIDVAPGATVGQLQPALDAAGATVIGMLAGRNLILVRVPDPGSLSALETLRAKLAAVPAIRAVWRSVFPKASELPANPAFAPVPPGTEPGPMEMRLFLAHHVAVRAPAAWNIRERVDSRGASRTVAPPLLIIIDHFGDGPPTRAGGYNLLATPRDYKTRNPSDVLSLHGYNVLAMVAADYGGSDASMSLATGMLPAVRLPLAVRALDLTRLGADQAYLKALQIVKDAGDRPIVLNTSLAEGEANCDTVNGICRQPSGPDKCGVQHRAAAWIRLVRGDTTGQPSLEHRFLHVTAAGNNPAASAVAISPEAAAGLQSWVPDASPCALPWEAVRGLGNVLAVEGRYAQADDLGVPAVIGCPNGYVLRNHAAGTFSPGGNISGIGTVSRGPQSADGTEWRAGIYLPAAAQRSHAGAVPLYSEGSSFATPQVAGAAILAWSLRPDLSPTDVKDLLLNTTMRNQAAPSNAPPPEVTGVPDAGCPGPGGYHMTVDAYAAILGTDGSQGALDLADKGFRGPRTRLALLDVAKVVDGKLVAGHDDAFTQADILFFLQQFEARRGALDYSRYDLNGDGYTGEAYAGQSTIERRRFDLDGNGSWTTASGRVENRILDFDEYAPADIGVLAFYAYSPLYAGNEYERALLLLPYLERMNSLRVFLGDLKIDVTGIRPTELDLLQIRAQSNAFTSACAGGERGAYSAAVAQAAQAHHTDPVFWLPGRQRGLMADDAPNTAPCSSFIATVPGSGRMWINSTSHTVDAPKGLDVEYQARFYLGEPDLAAAPAGRITPPAGRLQTQALSFGVIDKPGASFRYLAESTRGFKLEGVTVY